MTIKTAVILAAGLGSRLRDTFSEKPKGLFPIEGMPLVERSIRQLQAHGIERIILATGYMAHCYVDLAQKFSGVETIHNPHFADSGSLYTLYCVREVINEPFLLLESDLIYEDRALAVLLAEDSADSILLSGPTHSNDEVYVEARDNGLYRMSKNRADLTTIAGEMVGICKLSASLYQTMIVSISPQIEANRHLSYEEDGLTSLSQKHRLSLCKIEDLLWSEIDNAAHLERVLTSIWPQIQAKESHKNELETSLGTQRPKGN